MNWEALGAIGEIIGAIGVVASLFYVAYQVKQNTTQSKHNTDALQTASSEAANRAANEIRLRIAENESLSGIYHKGLQNPESLSSSELNRFRLVLTSALHNAQLVYEAYFRGINQQQWAPTRDIVVRLLHSPGGNWLWENYSDDFTDIFKQEVNRIKAEIETSDGDT